MIENFTPQPYPLWALRHHPDAPDDEVIETGAVIGWAANDQSDLLPVVATLGTPFTGASVWGDDEDRAVAVHDTAKSAQAAAEITRELCVAVRRRERGESTSPDLDPYLTPEATA